MAVDVDVPERELSARGELSEDDSHTAMTSSPSSGTLGSGVTEQYCDRDGRWRRLVHAVVATL